MAQEGALSRLFHKMKGTRMSLSRTNTAFCRELIVHMEIGLLFLCSCSDLGAEWDATLQLIS